MPSPVFALYLTCLFLTKTAVSTDMDYSSSACKQSSFLLAKTGEKLTLQCACDGGVHFWLYWYKKPLGQKPRLISRYYKTGNETTFFDELKNNPRFTLDTENGKNHLTISNLHNLDTATYYCISFNAYTVTFVESITVMVKDSGLLIPTLVHQSASETIQPGGSVTLNCTVQTGTCDGEHSVYWFKNSGESHPGLIYGGSNDQCKMNPSMQTQTCIYNLPMTNLNLSHAGTYYCAVASCGHIVFGNGTQLDFEHENDLVYFWRGASAFTTVLVVLLAFSVCMMNKKNSCQCSESQARRSAQPTSYAKDNESKGAALSVNLTKRSRLRDETWSECVYYSTKQ